MNIVRMELVRLLEWKRWGAVALVITVAGVMTAYNLATDARQTGVGVNQWDVPLFTLNHPFLMIWLFLPTFVGLIGDVVLRDRWTRFAMLSLPRIGNRGRWWAAKLGAVLIAAMLYYLGIMLVFTIIGLLFVEAGWPLSEYGRATAQTFSYAPPLSKGYDPPPFPTFPILGIFIVTCYAALATFAFVTPILAIAQALPRAWVPLVLTFVLVGVFFVITPTNGLHPLVHLVWDYHNLTFRGYAIDWWASALVLSSEILLGFVVGLVILKRCDI